MPAPALEQAIAYALEDTPTSQLTTKQRVVRFQPLETLAPTYLDELLTWLTAVRAKKGQRP